MTSTSVPILEVVGLQKHYGKTHALKNVSMAFHGGRVHGIAGHNGAGKSTLVRTLAGLEQPDSGELLLDGEAASFRTPADSLAAGVAVIQQTPQICETLSVAENLWLGRQPVTGLRVISWRRMYRQTDEELQRLGLAINPRASVESLSMAERQLVEIARAVSRSSRLMIMDEPTTALSIKEVDQLFEVVDGLRDHGVAVALIDHKLDEVMSVCDEISVLRDGRKVGYQLVGETSVDDLADQIVGHAHEESELVDILPSRPSSGTPRLAVQGLTRSPIYEDITFDVRTGEVVGLAGLIGSGRSRIAKALAGIEPAASGIIDIDGTPVRIRNVEDAHEHRIAYVPEDRGTYGLLPTMSIEANITLGTLGSVTTASGVSHAKEHELATEYAQRMGLIYDDLHQAVGELSGGNQQKVLLARWLAFGPSLLILDEPTQGIDIGVKEEIYRLIRRLAQQGLAVLVISSEFDELIDVCDRIYAVRHGCIVGERAVDETSASDLVQLVGAVSARGKERR